MLRLETGLTMAYTSGFFLTLLTEVEILLFCLPTWSPCVNGQIIWDNAFLGICLKDNRLCVILYYFLTLLIWKICFSLMPKSLPKIMSEVVSPLQMLYIQPSHGLKNGPASDFLSNILSAITFASFFLFPADSAAVNTKIYLLGHLPFRNTSFFGFPFPMSYASVLLIVICTLCHLPFWSGLFL